jgi:flagellar hook assembly protein FlgD
MEVRFALEQPSHASLAVYDIAGRCVRTLFSGPGAVGSHVTTWDGSDDRGGRVPAGVYLVRLDAGGQVATRKISLLR